VLYFYRAFFCTSRRLCVSVPAKTPRFSPARIFEQKMEEIIHANTQIDGVRYILLMYYGYRYYKDQLEGADCHSCIHEE
jgi:hypothetical protein